MTTLILHFCDHLMAICQRLPDALSRRDQVLLHRLDNETKSILALFQPCWDELESRIAQNREEGAAIENEEIHLLRAHVQGTLDRLRVCQVIGQGPMGIGESLVDHCFLRLPRC